MSRVAGTAGWGRVRSAGRIAVGRTALWALARSGDPLAEFLRPGPHEDLYGLYERMRARGALHRSRTGLLALTSHAGCAEVLRDPRFRVRDPQGRAADHDPLSGDGHGPLAGSFIEQDPPDHTRVRRIVAPAFRPAVIRGYRDRIAGIAHDLLDRAARRGSFDVIADLATPLPLAVITAMLGIPEADTDRFARFGAVVGQSLSGVYSTSQAQELHAATDELTALFVRLERERRESPGDDVISLLTAAHSRDELDLAELVAACGLLLIAGFETTVNLIGNAVVALAHQPDSWRLLCESPDLAAAVVEETLRHDPPVQATVRVPHEPVTLAGRTVAAGSRVMLMLGAANRDPDVHVRPDRFDLTRHRDGAAPDHLAFSSGIHYCLGASLARLEGEVALQVLAQRLPRLHPAGPLHHRRGNTIRGYATIPMTPPAR